MNVLAILKAALAASIAVNAEATRTADRKAGLLADAGRFEDEIRVLDAATAEREGEALAAGQPLPKAPLAERRQREKLERTARVAAGRIGATLDGRIAEQQRQAEAAVIDAALGASCHLRDEGQEAVRAGVEAMIAGLAEPIAAQKLRDRFAGYTFDFDGKRHPPAELWNGATVVRKFIDTVPPRLRPESFTERVEAAADERLGVLMAELEAGR